MVITKTFKGANLEDGTWKVLPRSLAWYLLDKTAQALERATTQIIKKAARALLPILKKLATEFTKLDTKHDGKVTTSFLFYKPLIFCLH